MKNKIIEFVGLPACGKTSLCEKLKEYLNKQGVEGAVWNDITSEAKKHPLRLIRCFHLRRLPNYIRLIRKLPDVKRPRYMYWFCIKIGLMYTYAKKYTSYEYFLVDHGYLQHIVSLCCGDQMQLTDQLLCAVKSLIKAEESVETYCVCNVDVGVAMERMKKRNRRNEGRLDSVDDDNTRVKMFKREEENIKTIKKIITSERMDLNIQELNCNSTFESVFNSLLGRLNGE